MGKWHGKNKSNKQKRGIYLSKKTEKLYLSKRNSINLPIIFYCKICKFETWVEDIFKKHQCENYNIGGYFKYLKQE